MTTLTTPTLPITLHYNAQTGTTTITEPGREPVECCEPDGVDGVQRAAAFWEMIGYDVTVTGVE